MMNRDRCCEDRARCRACPEQCFPDNVPMEAKEPTVFDRFAYGFSQWVSQSLLPGMARVTKAIQGIGKGDCR